MSWPARTGYLVRLIPVFMLAACAPKGAAVPSQSEARRAVEAVVLGQYSAVERGDLDAWADALTDDALLVGTAPNEVMVGRETIRASMKNNAAPRMGAAVRRTYRSTRMRIGIAAGGRSAWVADVIEYGVTRDGVTKDMVFRMTEALVWVDGRGFQIVAAHYSVAVTDERALSASQPEPAALPRDAGPGAEGIAGLVGEATGPGFPGRFSSSAAVLLVGTSEEEWIEGGDAVRAFVHDDGGGTSAGVAVTRTSGPWARVVDGGALGVVAYRALLEVPGPTGKVGLPVRVMAVLVKEGAAWTKVQEHVSLAVPD